MTGQGFDCIEGALGSRIPGGVYIVVVLGVVIEDNASTVVVLLVVDPELGEVRSVGAGDKLIDGDKGGLDDQNVRGAIRIVGICILLHFESVKSLITVGVGVQRISAGVAGTYKGSGAGLHAIEQSVLIAIAARGVRSGSCFSPVKQAIIVGVIISGVRAGSEFCHIGRSILIEIPGSG